MRPYTNRLIQETSPYLLQHAHNPVDWFPWGEEAFEKARKEDRPILVSIGYSACHWCHVMEKESFEDPEVAALMNQNFINIKVDREERPDVDHIYMDAVQAISGGGGWPLNVFLTPDRKPFYGGTYFPPRRAFNRASWSEVLTSIAAAYKENKKELLQQAEQLTGHLQVSNSFGIAAGGDALFEPSRMDEAFQNIMKSADREWGGFGRAPKFPQSFTINFLLQYGHLRKNNEAVEQAILSLDKMIQGGIYDQIGGGFARYSTDNEWLAPHFEKMLYDNALLIISLSDAYQLTRKTLYKEVIIETIGFIERELMHKDGGFFSALDADSEGEEGRFYVWDLEEVNAILGADAPIFSAWFDITEAGNWEGKNILRTKHSIEEIANAHGITAGELIAIVNNGKKLLLGKREQRVRPQLDDKVLLGWNALMNLACSNAYAATGERGYRIIAEKNMGFLLDVFATGDGFLHHTWKNGSAKHPAFLDDCSLLIAALIELAQVTGANSWLETAADLATMVLDRFADEESPFFFFTHKDQDDILIRKKEIYDGAIPSGNSVMAFNLYRLSILLGRPEWRSRAEQMVRAAGEVAIKYPTSFGVWLSLVYEMGRGTDEIAIVGSRPEDYLREILALYIPHKVIMASNSPAGQYPLLADKPAGEEVRIYLCRDYACQRPVSSIQAFLSLVERK